MTFKELKAWIDTLTADQLEAQVTAYSSVIDEATPVSVAFNSAEQMGEPLKVIGEDMPVLLLDE